VKTRSLQACALAGCFSILSCGSLPVSPARMDSLRASIERVTQAGALACAPRELALARAHYDFAKTELEIGNATRADRHIGLAEQNVGAAQVLTPDRGCASARDEVPAIPSSSMQSRGATRAAALRKLEADGGGVCTTFPAGAVNDVCLTTHIYGETRLDEAIASWHASNVLSIDDFEL
jgi:hypothetical protein